MAVPSDCKYAKSHEWAQRQPDGTFLVGITDYAQGSLGDITFVQLPKIGAVLRAGESFGVVESVKAASDLYAPIGGTILAINEELNNAPETVNRAPHTAGWMLRLQPSDPAEFERLLAPADYEQLLG